MTHIYPLPELLGRGTFEVHEPEEDGLVCVNLQDLVMYTPSDDSPVGRGQRMHELGHVAISPYREDDEGLDGKIVCAVEDYRITRYLNRNLDSYQRGRIASHDDVELIAMRMAKAKRNRLKMASLTAVSLIDNDIFNEYWEQFTEIAYGTEDGEATVKAVEYIVDQVRQRMGDTWEDTVRVSQWLERVFDPEVGDESASATAQAVPDLMDHMSEGVMKSLLGKKRPGGDPMTPEELAELLAALMREHDYEGSTWGTMEIKRPSLTKYHSVRHSARKIRPKEYGDSLRFIDRDETDGKVFGMMRRVKGGTILIDDSGSMGLRAGQLASIIEAAPNSIIAAYSGEGETGELRIIASHGRSVEDIQIKGAFGGNIIDGPALEWLAQQSRPRLWVSDGYVTGSGECTPPHLKAEANLTCVRNGIKRIGTPEKAVEHILKGGLR